MHVLELAFPMMGRTVPHDNGYELYAAISRTLGNHLPNGIAIASVGGTPLGDRQIQIAQGTRLRIRTPSDEIGQLLPLAGKFLDIGGHAIGLGVPEVRALEPAQRLSSRIVTIKGYTDPESFLLAAQRQLNQLGIEGQASIPVFDEGPRRGELRRRVIKIKDRIVIGFSLQVDGLSDADSYQLLANGLGGRRHMGCGIFVAPRQPGADR